jgi:V/A-type H+-transporting ATPase subunit E
MKSVVAEKILADAERETVRLQEEFGVKERELREEHEQRLKKLREEYGQQLDALVRAGVNRRVAARDLELKKMLLERKTEWFNTALGRCREKILDDPSMYRRFLVSMAVKGSLSGIEEIILSHEDAHAFGTELVQEANLLLKEKRGMNGQLRLSCEMRELSGGLILKDGNTEFNGTVSEAVQSVSENFMADIVHILFS